MDPIDRTWAGKLRLLWLCGYSAVMAAKLMGNCQLAHVEQFFKKWDEASSHTTFRLGRISL